MRAACCTVHIPHTDCSFIKSLIRCRWSRTWRHWMATCGEYKGRSDERSDYGYGYGICGLWLL